MSITVDHSVRAAVSLLADLADDHPVHRRQDLLTLGINDAVQSAMLHRGALVRLRHGVYSLRDLAETTDPVERHRIGLAAAVAGGRDPVWAFGLSAALTLGMPLPFTAPTQLALVRESGGDERALRRVSRHRLVIPDTRITTGPVEAGSTMTVRGVQVVGPALAGVSAASELTSARWQTALLDAALWRAATVDDLGRLVDTWRHLGHRAELLEALARARPGAQTVLETFSRLALMERGLPEPILQQPFYDEAGLIGYTDMWWPGLHVIGEADGAVKYTSRADLVKEKVREDRLRAKGEAVVRWTFEQIEDDPDAVAARIWKAARRAARPQGG
jgi:hypothetical protein